MSFDNAQKSKTGLSEDFSGASTGKEALKSFCQQIESIHQQNLVMLDRERDTSDMSAGEYSRNKQSLQHIRDEQIKSGPELIARELGKMAGKQPDSPTKTPGL